MNIGKILTDLRKQKKLSRQNLADKLEISVHTYIKYENESVKPPYETLIKIADSYGVTVDYLLGRKEPDPIQAFLASIKAVDSKQFVETYQQLPDIYQAILVDAMKRLSEASITDTAMQIKQRHVERLGDIEDEQEQERQAKDKGGTSCA